MSKRPKLSKPIEYDVLYASQFRCCICGSSRVQIHHIDFDRTNNDPKNLAVLCTPHHNDAHTTSTVTKNLTPAHIRKAKKQWESLLAENLAAGSSLNSPEGPLFRYWSYHDLRLFIFLKQSGIDPTLSEYFDDLFSANIIDAKGLPTYQSGNTRVKSSTLYRDLHARDALHLNSYLANLTDELIRLTKPKMINLTWPSKAVRSMLEPGSITYLCRQFYFRTIEDNESYVTKEMHTSANGFRAIAQFDTRNVHSTSALSHFSGNSVVAGLFLVRSADQDPNKSRSTLIKLTPIALGTGFLSLSGHKPLVAIQREEEEEA